MKKDLSALKEQFQLIFNQPFDKVVCRNTCGSHQNNNDNADIIEHLSLITAGTTAPSRATTMKSHFLGLKRQSEPPAKMSNQVKLLSINSPSEKVEKPKRKTSDQLSKDREADGPPAEPWKQNFFATKSYKLDLEEALENLSFKPGKQSAFIAVN